jgi:hypothetical protein
MRGDCSSLSSPPAQKLFGSGGRAPPEFVLIIRAAFKTGLTLKNQGTHVPRSETPCSAPRGFHVEGIRRGGIAEIVATENV